MVEGSTEHIRLYEDSQKLGMSKLVRGKTCSLFMMKK